LHIAFYYRSVENFDTKAALKHPVTTPLKYGALPKEILLEEKIVAGKT
jgi:hypothetical protein